MNILTTGGAGFIGSHMAERLVTDGHHVVVVDNEATGRAENVPSGAHYVRGDVTDQACLEDIFASGLDAVFHVAGQVSLIRSFTDPQVDLRTNIGGTVNVLQLCVKYRVPRLLYASSMTVYGSTDVLPTPEGTPCRPVSYYGITKYAAERYVHTTAERVDLDFEFRVTSFRMYNVYGPRQALDNPYQGVLGIFLGNLLRGEPITIFGDGTQSRDFIYIDDIVHPGTRRSCAHVVRSDPRGRKARVCAGSAGRAAPCRGRCHAGAQGPRVGAESAVRSGVGGDGALGHVGAFEACRVSGGERALAGPAGLVMGAPW